MILVKKKKNNKKNLDFPGGTMAENLPANAEGVGSIPGLGRFHVSKDGSLLPRVRALQRETPPP